ncbi:MAG TPA: hypothetical protein DCS19_05055 [Flavobacterium sp.]|nr:hypothetical protein [Flavobacterium sp.]
MNKKEKEFIEKVIQNINYCEWIDEKLLDTRKSTPQYARLKLLAFSILSDIDSNYQLEFEGEDISGSLHEYFHSLLKLKTNSLPSFVSMMKKNEYPILDDR